jgi:hypothetical protein
MATRVTPTRTVIRSGRRATNHRATAAAIRNSTAPTVTAGNAPMKTPGSHVCVLAGQLQMSQSPIRSSPAGEGRIVASQFHALLSARLSSRPSAVVWMTRAHGLKALTVR